jgi:AbrB family looped-hinge helix DNA binding protein
MVITFPDGMKEIKASIDQAGRIVLPKVIRKELTIKRGDVFKISVCRGVVRLTPQKKVVGFVRRGNALVFSAEGSKAPTRETVNAVLARSRAKRLS